MITIIGGGPAGSYLAQKLAGQDVCVFEEHEQIGIPVQCTGITTHSLSDIINIRKQFLINKINRARIIAPNAKFIDIKLKKPNLILDRKNFDRYLAERAEDRGVKFYFNQKYKNCYTKNGKLILNLNGKIRKRTTDILVGADGPFSQVAKTTGLWQNRKFSIGVQARISMEVEKELVEFYVNQNYFGWVVPESDSIARVGIAAYKQPNDYFKLFLARRNITNNKIREYQSGVIPIYNPRLKTQKKNIYLVGDAATHVKSTTFGGIIQGLLAAEELSKAIIHKKNYEKMWKKKIGQDLWLSLLIRKKLDRFSDKNYNKLVNLFQQRRIKKILETHDRDFISKFALQLLIKEPRLLTFLF